MKFLQLAATVSALVATTSAFAAGQTLHLSAPSTSQAFGQSASAAADAPLPVTFLAEAGTTLTALSWWGYHSPDSSGIDSFALTLNGAAVGATVTAEATGSQLTDPMGGAGSAMLMRYSVDLAGAAAQAGSNELSLINDDLGAVWWWQGTGAGPDPYAPAWSLTGMTQAVPEPQAAMLMLAGLLLTAGALQRRARHATKALGQPR